MKQNLVEAFSHALPERKGLRILDLGSGTNMMWAVALAKFGHQVVAVDRGPQETFHTNVTYHQAEAIAWLEELPDSVQFDGIFLRYILNAFPPQEVIERIVPLLCKHLKPGGVIAVEDMTQPSEPPIEGIRSYWTADNLWELFHDFKICHEEEGSANMLDMRAHPRTVHRVQIVARNETNQSEPEVGVSSADGYTRLRLNA